MSLEPTIDLEQTRKIAGGSKVFSDEVIKEHRRKTIAARNLLRSKEREEKAQA